MRKKGPLFLLLVGSALFVLLILVMQPLQIWHFRDEVAVLFPKGWVAEKERNLLLVIQVLMLFVIIPVYILTFVFSWIYRASNQKATYDPDLVDHIGAEFLWWGIPLVLTLLVAILTWVRTYELDPFRPLASAEKPLKIQVVALQWKWLFIYPEEKIASVNFLQFPTDTPLHFELTADAPMNSFWIPHLGGQIYAMPNMRTQLHLIANAAGDFRGSSANISGEGFSGMHFIARASTHQEYQEWLESARKAPHNLDFKAYRELAAPSQNHPAEAFQLRDEKLFEQVLNQHM